MRGKKIILILLVLFPLNVFASSYIEFECDKVSKKFSCDVYANSSFEVSAIEYHFNIDDMEIKSFDIDKSFNGSYENNVLLLYTDKNKKDRFKLGKINVINNKNKKKIKINEDYLMYGDSNFKERIIIKKDNENKYLIRYILLGVTIVLFIILVVVKGVRRK